MTPRLTWQAGGGELNGEVMNSPLEGQVVGVFQLEESVLMLGTGGQKMLKNKIKIRKKRKKKWEGIEREGRFVHVRLVSKFGWIAVEVLFSLLHAVTLGSVSQRQKRERQETQERDKRHKRETRGERQRKRDGDAIRRGRGEWARKKMDVN